MKISSRHPTLLTLWFLLKLTSAKAQSLTLPTQKVVIIRPNSFQVTTLYGSIKKDGAEKYDIPLIDLFILCIGHQEQQIQTQQCQAGNSCTPARIVELKAGDRFEWAETTFFCGSSGLAR